MAAQVSISASSTTADTSTPVTFTGHVSPSHAGQRVFLQQQVGNGDDWRTIDSGVLDGTSSYSITHRFRVPDDRDVRTVLRSRPAQHSQ